MILFENSIIKLDYTPATNILEIGCPEPVGYLLPEIRNSIDIPVDMVRNYDVKKVLLNSSTNTTVSVSPEESREIAVYLASGLAKTRIQKLARLQSPSSGVEVTASNNISHLQQKSPVPFPVENFTNKAAAIAWLKA